MNEVQLFKNDKLNLSIRAIKNDDGSVSMNVEDTAIGLGFTQTKNGVIYIRWDRINQYLKELGFPQNVGKGDYIPETVGYLLGMKGTNDRAKDFQIWIAKDVLPEIRKTGSYNAPQIQESEELKKLREQTEYVRQLNNLIDRYNGDTTPVDAILGIKGMNIPNTSKKPVALKNKDILNGRDIYKTIDAFLKSHRISEGDLTRDVYSKYCDYCHTLNVTPRTRQAFVLRMKEQTRFYTIQYKGNSVIRRR